MSPSQPSDDAVRAEAGAWLAGQTDHRSPELRWEHLRRGFEFRRGEWIALVGQRGIWKPRQMEMPLSIRTGARNPYGDSFDPGRGLLRYRYFGTDPGHTDNVGLRRAMAGQRPLAYFHAIRPGLYLPVWPVFIVGDDPASLTFTVAVDHREFATDSLAVVRDGGAAAADSDRTLERRYITREVSERLHQRVFRDRVLRAYRHHCAFCRLRQEPLLDAAHIIPDRDPTGDPVVPNGLALCKIHHAAFDQMFLGVDPRGVIHVRQHLLEQMDGPMLRHGLQDLHLKPIHRPRAVENRPDADRLNRRYQEFLAAS